jgi:predicted ester cyclase
MSVEENKPVIAKLEAAVNAGRVDAGLDLFTESCSYNGHQVGPEVIRQLRTILWSAVPDVRWTLEHMLAEGEWVGVRWTMQGTHTGDFVHPTLGTSPASGKPIAVTYLDHYRIEGGRIAEVWEMRDGVVLQQQFGIVAAPGQAG